MKPNIFNLFSLDKNARFKDYIFLHFYCVHVFFMVPDDNISEPLPVQFDRIDGPFVRKTTLRMDGAAGPSGVDAAGWKQLCTSFGAHSADLCHAISSRAQRICTAYVDPNSLEAFVACMQTDCSIQMSRCQTYWNRWNLTMHCWKAVSITLKSVIQNAVGPLQFCAGFESGCEAAVHAMHELFRRSHWCSHSSWCRQCFQFTESSKLPWEMFFIDDPHSWSQQST